MLVDEKETIRSELLCYHSRVSFQETTLGVGVSCKLNARFSSISNFLTSKRTQEIQSVSCCLDLISLPEFIHRRIRVSANNIPFRYWLPLYINEVHGVKAAYLAQKVGCYL
jgi:hypothetical protein